MDYHCQHKHNQGEICHLQYSTTVYEYILYSPLRALCSSLATILFLTNCTEVSLWYRIRFRSRCPDKVSCLTSVFPAKFWDTALKEQLPLPSVSLHIAPFAMIKSYSSTSTLDKHRHISHGFVLSILITILKKTSGIVVCSIFRSFKMLGSSLGRKIVVAGTFRDTSILPYIHLYSSGHDLPLYYPCCIHFLYNLQVIKIWI
jgi:hypothetical protein